METCVPVMQEYVKQQKRKRKGEKEGGEGRKAGIEDRVSRGME